MAVGGKRANRVDRPFDTGGKTNGAGPRHQRECGKGNASTLLQQEEEVKEEEEEEEVMGTSAML